MKYKDVGQGVFASMLLAGATVMFLVNGGDLPQQKHVAPVSSSVSMEIRQQASEQFQRISTEQVLRPAGEQPSWVF